MLWHLVDTSQSVPALPLGMAAVLLDGRAGQVEEGMCLSQLQHSAQAELGTSCSSCPQKVERKQFKRDHSQV